ncbi:S-protein homolog 2 [Linum perenne]
MSMIKLFITLSITTILLLQLISAETVTVTNQLSNNLELMAHCSSANDDLGARVVPAGSNLSWSFGDAVVGNTLFWCNLDVLDKHIHFDVYDFEHGAPFMHDWVVDDDGVHNVEGTFQYRWR